MKFTSIADIQKIYKQQKASFNDGKTRPIEDRLKAIAQIQKMIEENLQDFLKAEEKDGKCGKEALIADLMTTAKEAATFQRHLRSWLLPQRRSISFAFAASLDSAEILRDPLGIVLVIGTWNYAVNTAIVPVIGAIAGGNSVVLKVSEIAENIGELLANLIPKYVDPSILRVIKGSVEESTELLKLKWDHIFYTGNGTVGRVIAKAAAEHLTPVTLELGGKSPVFLDSSVNIDLAARRIVYGKFVNNGQTCIAPDYLLIPKSLIDKFIEAVKKTLVEFYGDEEEPSKWVDYGRIVSSRHWARLDAYLKSTKGKIAVGGQRDAKSRLFAPTIVIDIKENDALMKEELFGPILPILSCESLEDAIEFIRGRDKPLAAYLFSNDSAAIQKFKSQVMAGGMVINDTVMHFVCDGLPFGGVGESGMGAYHGEFSLKTFTHSKPVLSRSNLGELAGKFIL